MTPNAAKRILSNMIATKSGWGQKDFQRLLEGYGFKNKGGKKHDKYYHPLHMQLWISVPRHNELKQWVAVEAIKLIDELKKIKSTKNKK